MEQMETNFQCWIVRLEMNITVIPVKLDMGEIAKIISEN